jgi:FkbM family methyltransferase
MSGTGLGRRLGLLQHDRFGRAFPVGTTRGRLARRMIHALRPSPDETIARTIDRFARRQGSGVVFVQIGANDGVTNDPLHDHVVAQGWRGLVVEPVPHLVERLRSTYAGAPEVTVVPRAVSTTSGSMTFFHLRENDDGLPPWYDQLGSFSREQVLQPQHRAAIPNIEDYLVETSVSCTTLPELLEDHGIDALDLLHTDCEGYDLMVLRQLDFERYQPMLILIERVHLSPDDLQAARDLLGRHGYVVIAEGRRDLLAARRSSRTPPEEIRDRWRRLARRRVGAP